MSDDQFDDATLIGGFDVVYGPDGEVIESLPTQTKEPIRERWHRYIDETKQLWAAGEKDRALRRVLAMFRYIADHMVVED